MSCRLKNVSKLPFKDRICAMSKSTFEAKRKSLSFLHSVLRTGNCSCRIDPPRVPARIPPLVIHRMLSTFQLFSFISSALLEMEAFF